MTENKHGVYVDCKRFIFFKDDGLEIEIRYGDTGNGWVADYSIRGNTFGSSGLPSINSEKYETELSCLECVRAKIMKSLTDYSRMSNPSECAVKKHIKKIEKLRFQLNLFSEVTL